MKLCLELSLSSFCAVYIVLLLRQCYVALLSGYKLVITRALGMHGIYPSCLYKIIHSCDQVKGFMRRATTLVRLPCKGNCNRIHNGIPTHLGELIMTNSVHIVLSGLHNSAHTQRYPKTTMYRKHKCIAFFPHQCTKGPNFSIGGLR